MGRFRHYAKDRDENSTSCDEEGAKNHPEREYIAKDEKGKERVPQKGNSPERGEDNDWKGGDLEKRAKDVG